jgi:hypothetical protein
LGFWIGLRFGIWAFVGIWYSGFGILIRAHS